MKHKNLFSLALSFFVCSALFAAVEQPQKYDPRIAVPLIYNQKPQPISEGTKICLTMIVRNEAKIMRRCLDSVKNIIDCVSICVTGPSDDDNTKGVIEGWMKEHNMPGKVYRQEWKNFGYNRTLSAKTARETLKELGYSLKDTYLLFIDADMTIRITPQFNKKDLTADCYLMIQKNSALSYYNVRMTRASLPFRSIGVTHEYWGCDGQSSQDKINTIWIDDLNDGGCKSDKLERDIRLLTQGLIDEPKNERYMFYLAQSYKDSGKLDEAIDMYKKRIEAGGWFEEVFYAKYMLGKCYQQKNEWPNALHWYLEAFQDNPDRAETLLEVARHYRWAGKNQLAFIFAQRGKKVPYPKHQALFIHDTVYNYELDEELSIASYYTPFKNEGLKAIDRLTRTRYAPPHVRETAHRNGVFYIKNLEGTEFTPIKFTVPAKLHHGNSSIIKTENGYRVMIRSFNYYINEHQQFVTNEGDNHVFTRNFLLELDMNFNTLSQAEVIDNTMRRKMVTRIQGFEDPRLFKMNGDYWFSCSVFDLNPEGIPQIALCKLAQKPHDGTIDAQTAVYLKGPDAKRCEKNWLPFMLDGQLYMIYMFEPLTIYKPNIETGELEVIKRIQNKEDYGHFRGSAAPIPFEDGYLSLIHEVIWRDNKRHYIHRFVFFDKEFNITQLSKPFTFKHMGVEYCCSMTRDHSDTKLLMTMSFEERESYICSIPFEKVSEVLEPVS